MTSRFFASLPCPSTRVPITPGKTQRERGGQLPVAVALYHAQSSLGKVEQTSQHPTLFPRYASRIYLRLVVQTMLSNSG